MEMMARPFAERQSPAPKRTVAKTADTVAWPEKLGTEPRASASGLATSVILDDQAPCVAAGQMRRSEFLTTLEQAVFAAAEEGLSRVGRTARGCPFIRYMFEFYRGRDVEQLRRAVFRHAPETQWAATANEYVALVSERARRAVDVWASTGRNPVLVGPVACEAVVVRWEKGGVIAGDFCRK